MLSCMSIDPDSKTEFYSDIFSFYPPPEISGCNGPTKLYLVPTTHGENYDPDFSPTPTPLSELPEPIRWTRAYVLRLIEILAKRRPLSQIARETHRHTYDEIASRVGAIRELPRIQRIHRSQPIEGVIELAVILAFKNRVRVLVSRFEGVDGRWLCTEFNLL